MIEQTNIQDIFTDAISARDEKTRKAAVLSMTTDTNPDYQRFGQIAQIVNGVIYGNADPNTLKEVSVKFYPVPQTRENFAILETCFYLLYTKSKDTTNPERSRLILDESINLLNLIGRNGFDISEGTEITLNQRHPMIDERQQSQLKEALRRCKANTPTFATIPTIAAILKGRDGERPKKPRNHSDGRVKA